MITGSVQPKNGKWCVVISYKKGDTYKTKWVSTGYSVEKTKKSRAEKMIPQIVSEFTANYEKEMNAYDNILFTDYMSEWLERQKPYLAESTHAGYSLTVKTINDYFMPKKIRLSELTAKDINQFYDYKLRFVKPNTVLHYHANISKALNDAYKRQRIGRNPMDFVEKPKMNETTNRYYNAQELKLLLNAVRGDALDVCINIAVKYGLRRSEILGLKWDAIDFKNNTINIQHKVIEIDGKVIGSDILKTKTSRRTLCMTEEMKKLLTAAQCYQELCGSLCGAAYDTKWDGYVCRFPTGEIISPNYVTQHFEILLKKYHLPKIRFHDLRHSCASVLINNGTEIKLLQQFLGHSTISTTANTYTHLYSEYSKELTNSMEAALK